MKYLLLLFISVNVYSQSGEELKHCGTDEMHQQLFQEHPEYNSGIIRAHSKAELFRAQYETRKENERVNPYIIPVVFHVIHNYGTENISDAQVYDAIRVVNENYRKKNPDTVDIIPAFQSIAADNEIELRLAQLDPNGNCTSGINRIASTLTYTGDHQVKNLIHWDPSKYLNVYIVDNAAGLAGHALVPPAADTIPLWDGIVISHDYVGSIGTSNYVRSVVLSHEFGHYLGLEHVWGGNNVPGYFYLPCADAGNCAFDDGVADTPNTIGWQTCNLNGASCGNIIDNVQNFMDYAYCARMFTEGQKLRMHATLNDTIANRNNLWQTSNLIATGTDGNDILCAADFTSDKIIICEGETITFTDNSYHGVTQWNWTFPGGSAGATTDSVVTVTYNTAGTYDVSLIAGNGSSTVSETKTNYITVLPAMGIVGPIIEGFETTTSLPSSDWFINNPHQDGGFELNNTVSSSGTNSVSLDLTNALDGFYDELISTTYDVSNLSAVQISFRYAFANRDSVPQPNVLKIYVSNDCGNLWSLKKQIGAANLSSAPGVPAGNFIPLASEWKTGLITAITSAYFVDDFRMKFVYENVDGVALYIDDINISPTASVEELEIGNLKLYPNPGYGSFYFEVPFAADFSLAIYDLGGRLVEEKNARFEAGIHSYLTDNLPAGSYLVSLQDTDNQLVSKYIWLNFR